jgi:thiamine-phosphate diphosphorylase
MQTARKHSLDLSIYLVTDSALCQSAGRSVLQTVQKAVAGGATTVQIREKHATARDFLALVQTVAQTLPSYVTLLVNDRVDVYLAARAQGAVVHGVHVGQNDFSIAVVRQLVGAAAIVGLTADTDNELRVANASAPLLDYVGIGPLYATATKTDTRKPLGYEGIARMRALTDLPAVAIGGIKEADVPVLRRKARVQGVAVVSAICAAADARDATQRLVSAWKRAI